MTAGYSKEYTLIGQGCWLEKQLWICWQVKMTGLTKYLANFTKLLRVKPNLITFSIYILRALRFLKLWRASCFSVWTYVKVLIKGTLEEKHHNHQSQDSLNLFKHTFVNRVGNIFSARGYIEYSSQNYQFKICLLILRRWILTLKLPWQEVPIPALSLLVCQQGKVVFSHGNWR